MPHSKMPFVLVVFMLFTVVTFLAGLEAQDTEEKSTPTQEFVERAKELVYRNQLEEAIEIYVRIVIAAPEDYESQLQLATLYSRINQHEKAAKTYSKLLKTDPDNTIYQDGLVNSLQAAGRHNEALEFAQNYIQTNPTVGMHYARLARIYEVEGNEAAALTNYNKAIKLTPGHKQTYLKLARLSFLNGDIDAAEMALKNAILSSTSASERQEVEQQLVSFYRYHGNLKEKLQQAEDDGTITFQMRKVLAEYYHKTDELEKAANTYVVARDMTTDSDEVHSISAELLKIFLQLGDMDSVIEPYETAVNLYTNSETQTFTSERIAVTSARIAPIYKFETKRDLLIDTFKSQDKLEDLKAYYEGELLEDIENPTARIILARIYWDEKDYQKSAEMYEALGNADASNVRYFYYAAAALKKNNQPELAQEMLNQAETALAFCSEKDDTWFLGSLATICIENRMFEPAIELSKSAIDKRGSDIQSMLRDTLENILAKSYRETKRYEEAYELYQKIANMAGSASARTWAKRAIPEIGKEGKLYEKWIQEQLKNVEKNPNNPELILILAESYEATDRIKEAIEQYEKLTRLEPERNYIYSKLGDLYQSVDLEVDKVIEGNALSLDGDGSYVEIVDSEIINNISEKVTVSAWIKPIAFPNTCTTLLFKGNKRTPNLSHRQFALWLFDEGCVYFDASPDGLFIRWTASASETIQKNQWYHVAGTIDAKNDSMKLYLNGIEVRSHDFKGQKNLTKTVLPLRIGCSHEEEISEHASFAGLIDEVRVWNIARTENQIRSDMNKQLKGDEDGLVGYWKFDAEIEGRVFDSSPNKNDGKLFGNAKLEPYSRSIMVSIKNENLTKAASYYEKAIKLKPSIYQYYDRLAKLYMDQNQISDAVFVYLRALDVPFRQVTHNSFIHAISEFYAEKGQEDKIITILEKMEPKMQESVVLYEILGDLYKKTGDSDKAALAYAKWLKLRQKEVNGQGIYHQRLFAEELLEKGLFPEIALKYAKRALQDDTMTSYDYLMTFGHASIANGLYDDALRNYIYALSIMPANSSLGNFLKKVTDAGKNANDKARYKQMLEALKNSIPLEYVNSVQLFVN